MLTNKTDNELKMEDGKNINAEQFLNGIIKSINKAPQGEYTATITRGLTCPERVKILIDMVKYLADENIDGKLIENAYRNSIENTKSIINKYLKREGTLYYVLCNKCKARGPIVKCVDEVYKNGVCINNQKEVLKAVELWDKGR